MVTAAVIIASLKILKGHEEWHPDTFTLGQMNITSHRNGMLSAGVTFLWQE